jgi:hypothetical protein
VKIGRKLMTRTEAGALGGRGKKASRNTRGFSVGESDTAAYIRARLERDGKTELLAQVEHGEICDRS